MIFKGVSGPYAISDSERHMVHGPNFMVHLAPCMYMVFIFVYICIYIYTSQKDYLFMSLRPMYVPLLSKQQFVWDRTHMCTVPVSYLLALCFLQHGFALTAGYPQDLAVVFVPCGPESLLQFAFSARTK